MKRLPHDSHSSHAERVLLSGLMREPEANVMGLLRVTAADLYVYRHRLVFAAAFELWGGFCSVTPADVYRRLWMRGRLADLGHDAVPWLWDLYECDPTGFDCLAAAETVLHLSRWRQVLVTQRVLLADLERGRVAPEELLEMAR